MAWRFSSAAPLVWGVLFVSCFCLVGCGGAGRRVSGKVTFNGKAVPAGKVYILPDGAKGNKGPTGFADIKDGQYDTSWSGGRGAVSGAVIIAVEGIDNAPPDKAEPDVTTKLLFARWEVNAEISGSSLVKDIDVPAEAAKGPLPAGQKPGQIVP